MKSFAPKTVVAVTTFLLAANTVLAEDEFVGCYAGSGSEPAPLEFGDTYTWQSTGHCRGVCADKGAPVMGLTQGSECFCGDKLPAESAKLDKGECDTPCLGYPQNVCGSDDNFSVYLTALKPLEDIEIASAGGNSGSSSTDSGGSSTVTDGGQTVVVTSPGEANPVESEDDGPNTGAIAAGVVVGVAALAAIIGGGWFFMRRRNRKAMENEHHRTATIDHFVAGGKPNSSSSMSDSRLDPSMMAHRRQSDGSIADNQDFSRRILQVTNPDGH